MNDPLIKELIAAIVREELKDMCAINLLKTPKGTKA